MKNFKRCIVVDGKYVEYRGQPNDEDRKLTLIETDLEDQVSVGCLRYMLAIREWAGMNQICSLPPMQFLREFWGKHFGNDQLNKSQQYRIKQRLLELELIEPEGRVKPEYISFLGTPLVEDGWTSDISKYSVIEHGMPRSYMMYRILFNHKFYRDE
jgi:hypothetical protein